MKKEEREREMEKWIKQMNNTSGKNDTFMYKTFIIHIEKHILLEAIELRTYSGSTEETRKKNAFFTTFDFGETYACFMKTEHISSKYCV